MENKIAWEKYPEGNKREEVFQFAENYRKFISDCKTERECVTSFVEKAEKAGFVNLEKVIAEHTALKAGDRVYANNMGKGMALFVIGKESMEKGMNILGAHIDSPRLDLKQDPLYEDTDFAMLDTHYYGGIKKYQWVTLPLALHGVIAKKDGTVVKVNVGDKPGRFCMTSILSPSRRAGVSVCVGARASCKCSVITGRLWSNAPSGNAIFPPLISRCCCVRSR